MATLTRSTSGGQILRELQEFASFPAETQRYIRRSLEAASGNAERLLRDAATEEEIRSIEAQIAFYAKLGDLEAAIPVDDDIVAVTNLMRWLIPLSSFDLAHKALNSFAAYRFLYERLLGAAVRPWLLGAFCTAAAHPQLHPHHRRQLLDSIDPESCGSRGWSIREPAFDPLCVEEAEDQ